MDDCSLCAYTPTDDREEEEKESFLIYLELCLEGCDELKR